MVDMMHRDHKEVKKHFGQFIASSAFAEWIQQALADVVFLAICHDNFEALNANRNATLSPSDISAITVELRRSQPSPTMIA